MRAAAQRADDSVVERARLLVAVIAADHAGAVDRGGRLPVEAIEALRTARLMSAFIPVDLGGEGASVSEIGAICHLLGQNCGATGLIYAMHQIQVACLVRHGETPWHRDFLRRAARDQWLLASATTEGATGGDLGRSVCAVDIAADRFTLEKRGAVISYAEAADAVLATARRAPDAMPSDQSLVVIERGQMTLEKTEDWNTLGMRGTCSHTYDLTATGRAEQILPCAYGDIQDETMVPFSHLVWSCVWLGLATDALMRARRYLAAKQPAMIGVTRAQSRLVEATARWQQMRAAIVAALDDYAAVLAARDQAISYGRLIAANNLKISTATGVVEVIDQAMLICGLAAYRNDGPFSLGRHLRDARSAALMVSNDRINAGLCRMLLTQRGDLELLS